MIVFVTGGIGAGKSTALHIFADLGAHTERADDIVHQLLAQSDVQQEVASLLGIPDASDRAAIAEIVFGDASKRTALEAIIHPRVAREVMLRAAGSSEPLVYEVPLLPNPGEGDLVIVIDAPDAIRLQRLVERGMSDENAKRRMAAQPPREAYLERADIVVPNIADEAKLRADLTTIWEGLRR